MSTETSKITEVEKYSDGNYGVSTNNASGFMIRGKYGVEPKIGDSVTLHTKGFSFIRGIDINGVPLFYSSDEKIEADRQQWLKDNEEKKQREFEENKAEMDAKYNALPQIFKDRIDRFRTNNPDFRKDYEDYEVFCCEQAILIAESCKTPEKVAEFQKMGWEEQKNTVTGLSSDHSGNTFGSACMLAYVLLKEPESVSKVHGALSTLVGSEAYGDIPKP